MTVPAPDCAHCPFGGLDGKPRHEPVWGEVCGRSAHLEPPRAPIGVMVGEGPGNEEVAQGLPFKGSTGLLLDEAMEKAGLVRGRLALINAMACKPPQGMKTNENLRDATAACRPLFMHQYERYAHLPTLAMGKWATAAANKGKAITIDTGRGFIRNNLLATWHPTYAFYHNPWKAGEFLNDLARFKRMLTGTLEAPPRVIVRPTLDDLMGFTLAARAFANELHALTDKLGTYTSAMTLDIETRPAPGRPDYEGKDPTRADMRCFSFGTPMLSVSHWWGNGERGVESKLLQWMADPLVLKVWHNGIFFDGRVLRRLGLTVRNSVDTRALRRAVSATSKLSLRFNASVYSDFAPWKETEDDK